MIYERTKNKGILISIFIFSILSSLAILFTPFKIHQGSTSIHYWFFSGIGYHQDYILMFALPVLIISLVLIIIPIFNLIFKKQFSTVEVRRMRRYSIIGSVMGLLISILVIIFTPSLLPGTNSFTVTVGYPYVYFAFILILTDVTLRKKNTSKLFSEITTE